MNKIYKIVWNTSSQMWVATSELAKGKTKSSSLAKTAIVISTALFAGTSYAAIDCFNGTNATKQTTNNLSTFAAECTGTLGTGIIISANADGSATPGQGEGVLIRGKSTGGGNFLNYFYASADTPTSKLTVQIGDSNATTDSTFTVYSDKFTLGTATTKANATASQAIGAGAVTTTAGTNSTAIGTSANVSAANSVALGSSANASIADSVALGSNSTTTAATGTGFLTNSTAPTSVVSVGSATTLRRIQNIADGAADQDAVTVAQLRNVNTTVTNIQNDISSSGIGLIKQDSTTKNILIASDKAGTLVTVNGTDGNRAISGVANGSIASGSTQAITGDQLNTSYQNLATSLGGGAKSENGVWTAPSYNLTNPANNAQTAYTNVGDALGALNTAVNSPITFTGDKGMVQLKN